MGTMDRQSQDFKYFVENHDMLFAEYPNRFLVIQNQVVVLTADTFEDALDDALGRGLEPGTFIVQKCTEGDESYVMRFGPRVVFA